MADNRKTIVAGAVLFIGAVAAGVPAAGHGPGAASGDQSETQHMGGAHMGSSHTGAGMMGHDINQMRELHRGHTHQHDFEAIEEMSTEQRARMMALMHDIGLALPPMNPERGRHLFVEKGCVACHSVNGVGGHLGPELNADDMPVPMNAFEFAARMWRGAPAMAALQEDMLGEAISLDGQDLADLIAFAHDAAEQAKLTEDPIPEKFHSLIEE